MLQRINEAVTEACIAVDKAIRTDILELRRPWFADNHNEIISPLFFAVSKYWVVFYTDESMNTVSFYRHTLLPRKIHIVSGGESEGNDDNVPLAPHKVSCKSAAHFEIEITKLSHPSGIAVRGPVIYIGEHPRECQGAVHVMYSLKGLVSFQTIWRCIAYSMGLISKRSIGNNTELAKTVITQKLKESDDELQAPAEQLKCLIESTVERTGAESVDITYGSMASRTAQAVYHTLVEGEKFLL